LGSSACCPWQGGGAGEEVGADAGRLASTVRFRVSWGSVALRASPGAFGGLVGHCLIRAWHVKASGFAADIIGSTFGRAAGFGSERNDRRRRRFLRGGRDHGHEGGEDKNGERLHV